MFEGALIIPMYDIAFEADASENYWGCDHMALAESSDGTPGAMHGCPSLESSDRAFRFVMEHNSNPLCVNGTTQVIKLENVALPECDNKTRTHRVQMITLHQKHTAQECLQYFQKTN